MFKKSYLLLLLLFVFTCNSYAQSSFSNFQGLHSEGRIPKDFVRYNNDPKLQNSTLSFLFKSGLILYGTELNQYLDKILDNLLVDYPKVRREIRVYIFKSAVVNAMAFEDNVIVVNLGLIAQVQNESELAFILAHELVHIVNKHIEKEKKNRSKKNKRGTPDAQNSIESFMSHHYRSREHEVEADKEGFEKYYKNSGYSLDALDGVFDVLQFSFLPFDEVPFDKAFLETNFYNFPKNYALVNLTPIRSREDYIDTLSTHPNILKRRILIYDLIKKNSTTKGELFLQSEELFEKVRHMARLESINTFLTYHEYGEAFYNAYILLQKDPQSQFLNRAIVASLYGIYCHKVKSDISNVLEDYKNSEGQIQQSNYFLKKIPQRELALLVLRFSWLNLQKYPEDPYLEKIAIDMFHKIFEMKIKILTDQVEIPVEKNEIAKNSNNKTVNERELNAERTNYDDKNNNSDEETDSELEETEDFVEIVEKLETSQSGNTKDANTDILNRMFFDLRKDSVFVKWVEKQRRRIIINSDLNKDQLIQQDMNACKKLLAFAPNLYIVKSDYSYKNKPKSISNTILNTDIPNTTIEVLSFNDEIASSTDSYNLYCKLKALYFDLKNSNSNGMQLYQSANIESVIELTGTTYITFVDAILLYPYMEYDKIGIGLLATIVPVMAPFTLFHIFVPKRASAVEIEVINIETGNILHFSENNYGYNNRAFIHNFMYSKIKNIKKENSK